MPYIKNPAVLLMDGVIFVVLYKHLAFGRDSISMVVNYDEVT
jgi:hypothetical protein